MKKVVCLAVAIMFVLASTAALAQQSGCASSSDTGEKGGWQRMYDDMNDMFAGKSSTKDKNLRGKTAKVKTGTEIQPKTGK